MANEYPLPDSHAQQCSCLWSSPWGQAVGETRENLTVARARQLKLWWTFVRNPHCEGCNNRDMGKIVPAHCQMDVFAIMVYHPEMAQHVKGEAKQPQEP